MSKPHFSDSYKRYVLLALAGVYVFNFIDRQILVILQESIKADLDLSDKQLGLLTGFAFAVFYVILGLPIARLADKSSRRNIIAMSLGLWSAMTALSGLAANFVQLLLARIGVGVGEAGGSPPAHSMISDYFPEEKRATALSIYSMGIYIGVLLGFLLGGWLNQFFGWRMALLVLGLPGLLYALFFYFTVKEPPRGYSEHRPKKADIPSMAAVLKEMLTRKSFVYLALGSGFNAFVIYGLSNWLPSFLERLHGMQSGEIGSWLALGIGGGGALGVWLGGFLADKVGQTNRSWYLLIPAITVALSIPTTLIALFSETNYLIFGSILISEILLSTYLGPCIAMAHGMVGVRSRALASAVLFLVLNFIGLGLGPLGIGIVSDFLEPDFGIESLRWALSGLVFICLITSFLFWKGTHSLEADLKRTEEA